jgi:hypothetical protein
MADSSQVPFRASIFDSMTFRRAGLFVVAATAPPPMAPPSGRLPDMRETWTGTSGGAPITLVILDQIDAAPVDSVSVSRARPQLAGPPA